MDLVLFGRMHVHELYMNMRNFITAGYCIELYIQNNTNEGIAKNNAKKE